MNRADLRRALAEELSKIGEEERSRFGDEVIVWLAVAPAWPEPIALQCGFPGDLMKIGPELENAGLAQRAVVTDARGAEETHWWMPSTARRETVAAMHRRDGGRDLIDAAALVAQRMGTIRSELPPALARWAALALDPWSANHRLQQEVTPLVATGNTAEALAWVEAARFLAAVLGGALVTGVVLAERQIELAYRTEHDRKLLTSFLERPDQLGWVERLLSAPDEAWALHLLGAGGVGKTMLLRFVTAKLAPKRGRGIVAVRIDFDHLSPDYPVRRPGQLVAALAGELRLHATGSRQASLFKRLDDEMIALDEALSAELPPADPLANIRRPELDRLLDPFAEIVRVLPEPVLFILDTCEELAKLVLPGGSAASGPARAPPAVEATFEILGKLHKKVPSLRVLFAGRRFLASKGLGWEVLGRDSEGAAALPERGYLALEELRGFDEAEADDLFEKVYGLTLSGAQRSAVLERSREVAVSRVKRPEHSDNAGVARYHPFDLALYAGWIMDDHDVEPAALAGGDDPYVELRILGRIEHGAVRAAVPTLVLLRRFDRAMAAAALGLRGEDELGETLRRIADQEWVDVQPDDETGALFYELHRALWPRLARFYASGARRSELDETKRRVGPALEALARSTEPTKLRAECVDAALRALPPKAGGALWSSIEERAANEGAYERLRAISGRLLAEGGAASPGTPLRAHVLATYLGVEMRSAAGPGMVTAQWKEVLEGAATVPDPGAAEWIVTRSRAWLMGWSAAAIPVIELMALIARDTENESSSSAFRLATLRAALTAALDRVLETSFLPHDSVEVISRWSEALASRKAPIDLIASIRLLAARAAAIDKSWGRADSLFEQAITEAEIADRSPKTPRLDGQAPPSFEVRARLVRASFMPLLEVDPLPSSNERNPTGEQGRLLAHAILSSLAHGSVHFGSKKLTVGAALLHIERESGIVTPPFFFGVDLLPPRSKAAQQVPPRFIAIARQLTAIGQSNVALYELDQVIQAALTAGDAAFAMRVAEREKLRIFRRYRVPPGELVERLASGSDSDARHEARAYLAIVKREPLPRSESDPELGDAWRHDREHVERIARALLRSGGLDLPGERREWLESLPRRFVAELALEEGELLALESPKRGAALLAHARAAFRQADDPLGILFTWLLGIEAEINAKGNPAALRVEWIDQVMPAYERIRVLLGLPPPDEIAPRLAEPRFDDPWRAWLARIHQWNVELAHEANKKLDESSVTFGVSELLLQPSSPAGRNLQLPDSPQETQKEVSAPEPSGFVEPVLTKYPAPANVAGFGPPPPPQDPDKKMLAGGGPPPGPIEEAPITLNPGAPLMKAPVAAPHKITSSSFPPPDLPTSGSQPRSVAIALAGLAILAIVSILYYVSGNPLNGPAASTLLWAALWALGAGAVLFGGYRVNRFLRASPPPPPLLPGPPISKRHKPVAQPELRPRPKVIHAVMTLAEAEGGDIRITISMGGDDTRTWTIAFPDVAAPYDRLLAEPPEDLTRALAALRAARLVTIDVLTSRLAAPAWEALIPAHNDLEVGSPTSAQRRVLRTRSESTLRRASGPLALLAGPRWTPLATSALRLAKLVVMDVAARTTDADRAVVVIGRPLRTSVGLVLQVGSVNENVERKGATQTRGGEHLQPGEHPLFDAPIVVLVAEPVESLERSAVERAQAADLRVLAHGIAQQSGVVIVVPALPTPVTRGVLEIIAERLANDSALDHADLVDLTILIREVILGYDASITREDERTEASLDVVVYAGSTSVLSRKHK